MKKARSKSNLTQKQKGFTLLELLLVIGIIGILVSVFLGPIQNALTGGPYSRASLTLKKNFTEIIGTLMSRSAGSCAGITKDRMTDRGLDGNTAWGDDWTVTSASNTNVVVNWPLSSNDDRDTDGADLANDLNTVGNISATYTAPNLVVTYSCG